ncbi:MAG: DUF1178 family protein [Betaproteobacteria bacterium]|nr:DUF1178 family protein [Betaproteobacteria bacterium]
MIVLNLSCSNSHSFEGWFASLEEFQRQAVAQQVTCPHCNDVNITKLPAGSHVRRAVMEKSAVPASISDEAKVLAALEQLLNNSDNVGASFPEEARKIHYEETPARNIHGTASVAEVRSLLEEDIGVIPLPLRPRKGMH